MYATDTDEDRRRAAKAWIVAAIEDMPADRVLVRLLFRMWDATGRDPVEEARKWLVEGNFDAELGGWIRDEIALWSQAHARAAGGDR